MADKYHINPKTGNPNKCTARPGKCPFGVSTLHYPSQAKARKAYEGLARAAYQEQEQARMASLKKAAKEKVEADDDEEEEVVDPWLVPEEIPSDSVQEGQVAHVVGNLIVSTVPLKDEWTNDKLWETMVMTPDSQEIFVRHSDSEKESKRDHRMAVLHAQKVAPVYRQAGDHAGSREEIEEANAYLADHPVVEIRMGAEAAHEVTINGATFPVQSLASVQAVERTIEAGLWNHAQVFKDDFENYVSLLDWEDDRLHDFQVSIEELIDSREVAPEDEDFLMAQKDYVQVSIARQVKIYERDREETRRMLESMQPQSTGSKS